jgi:hypothetical protein
MLDAEGSGGPGLLSEGEGRGRRRQGRGGGGVTGCWCLLQPRNQKLATWHLALGPLAVVYVLRAFEIRDTELITGIIHYSQRWQMAGDRWQVIAAYCDSTFDTQHTGEWKGAIAQPGLSEYSIGAAGQAKKFSTAKRPQAPCQVLCVI